MATAVIATIGEDRPGLVNELSQLVLETGLNIEDSRMTVLGGEFAVLMSVAGAEADLTALEAKISVHAQTSGLMHLFRRTSERVERAARSLHVRVEAVDHPGIVHGIAGFFSERGINIRELETETQHAAHTGAPVFNVQMLVELPEDQSSPALTDAFETFCDTENLDGSISKD